MKVASDAYGIGFQEIGPEPPGVDGRGEALALESCTRVISARVPWVSTDAGKIDEERCVCSVFKRAGSKCAE
jgi:hypothetical protein